MPTVHQLPNATNPNPTDQVLLQQATQTASVTVANLLANTQPAMTLATGALVGRASLLPGQPEPIGLGGGIVMQNGTLLADTTIVAALASPALSGRPTAPTPPAGDNSTALATTAFVQSHPGTITAVGDVTGSGNGTVAFTLPAITSPGSFPKVTVNAKGQVTSGTALAATDVTTALGFTPYSASNPAGFLTTAALPAAGVGLTETAGTFAVALSGLDASASTVLSSNSTAPRSLAARAADRINVLDFGADPTGVADSLPAFYAAAASVPAGQHVRLFVPRGTFHLSSNFNDNNNYVSVELDDGATVTGGVFYVGRTEQRTGGLLKTFTKGTPINGAVGEYLAVDSNTNQAGNGRFYSYDNYNFISTNLNGGDVAATSIADWHNIAGTAGFGRWDVAISPMTDLASTAVGNNWAVVSDEFNIVNNGPDFGWTDVPGSQAAWTAGPYVEVDIWAPSGGFGGHTLWGFGVTCGQQPNSRWSSYPAVFSVRFANATAAVVTPSNQIAINGTTVTLSGGAGTGSITDVAASINAAAVANVAAAVDNFARLVIYSTNSTSFTLANVTGAPLAYLGIGATTYTLPQAPATILRGTVNPLASRTMGATDSIKITTKHTAVGGVTISLAGLATTAAVVTAINNAGIQYFTAAVGYTGEVALAENTPGPITLANVSGTPLATLGLPAGTTQPPSAPLSAVGPYLPGSYNGFFVQENAIAAGGRAFYAGGSSTSTVASMAYAPFEARYNYQHGIRLEYANTADNNALTLAPQHTITWGTGTAAASLSAAPNLAALRAIPAGNLADGQAIILLAYATRGDGGSGMFTWNAASTATDNGGTVVDPTGNTGAGRWLRQLADGRVTPQMFGAKGDGVTNDTAAFNAALLAGPVIVPDAHYIVANVAVPSGAWMEGGAGLGYSYDVAASPNGSQNLAVVSPILIAATGTTSCILNVNGTKDATVKGLFLDGGTNTATCDGISSGSTQLMMERVTITRCVNGLGATSTTGYTGLTDLYTHVATMLNCEFCNNTNGVTNLIDSYFTGGAVSANSVGVNLGSGANANTFSGCRYEWNTSCGVEGYSCASNVFLGGLFDRNSGAAVNLGTGCADFSFVGVNFNRNGANNTYPGNAHIQLNGTTSTTFTGCISKTGYNDTGTGNLTPAYFIEFLNTNGYVSIVGSDVSGYVTGFSFGTNPTSFVQRDNIGGGANLNNAQQPFMGGGRIAQTLYHNASANITPGQSATFAMTQAPFTSNYSTFSRTLNMTAQDFNSPYEQQSASFKLMFSRGTTTSFTSASAAFGECGGTGVIVFGTGGKLGLAISNVAADGSTFTLTVTNDEATSTASNWGAWAELE